MDPKSLGSPGRGVTSEVGVERLQQAHAVSFCQKGSKDGLD